MFNVEVRPSLRMLQQVARLERFSGFWERASQGFQAVSEMLPSLALIDGVRAISELDHTMPPASVLRIRELKDEISGMDFSSATPLTPTRVYAEVGSTLAVTQHNLPEPALLGLPEELRALFECHQTERSFSPGTIELTHRMLCGEPLSIQMFSLEDLSPQRFRSSTGRFLGPGNEVIFTTVPAFIIEQRLSDLIEWTARELEDERFHPLVAAGVFYLLFLQISPYPSANHRLAIVLLWQILAQSGFNFVQHKHFADYWHEHSAQYFNALRQAEKTAHGNWSTLNVWLEFFFQTLCHCCEDLQSLNERTTRQNRLSAVQRDIIEVIRTAGSCTRERIVRDTGINLSTVKYNLAILSSRGHLKREGGGRTTSYTLL